MSHCGALTAGHPLGRVHRAGAAVLGGALVVFGGAGFAQGLPFLAVRSASTMGMGSNGLLATISVAVGLLLVAAAWRGGALASNTLTVLGALFLVSGVVNLALLDTAYNVLAFRFANVVFSLLVGMALLFTGTYGRVSGGLADDNPYVRARTGGSTPQPERSRSRLAEIDEISTAENAVSNGVATDAQSALVRADRLERARAHRAQCAPRT